MEKIPVLTKLSDTDYHILNELDDDSLYHTCQTNKYIQRLCNVNIQLRKRVKDYGDLLLKIERTIENARNASSYRWYSSNKVYIHIIYNYKRVLPLHKFPISNVYFILTENDLVYIIGGDFFDIFYSIKKVVEALGYPFNPKNIHPREGLASEIEYDL